LLGTGLANEVLEYNKAVINPCKATLLLSSA